MLNRLKDQKLEQGGQTRNETERKTRQRMREHEDERDRERCPLIRVLFSARSGSQRAVG